MKKDKSRERKKSNFERDLKIKKVAVDKENGKQWKRFLDEEELED